MRVGVPREIKVQENRVGLAPGAAREYAVHGHEVLVETGAGEGIGASDGAYREAGARIAADADELYAASDMIVKVKEPQPEEWKRLREGQILYAYLHLAADPEQARGLQESGCAAVAYETVRDEHGGLPLLAPMSEVAGRLSVQAAAHSLEKGNGGQGLLLGGVPGVPPARVAVIGGGVVGANAARIAAGMGAEVTILDRSLPRLRELDGLFGGRVRTLFSKRRHLEEAVAAADAVIGAVLVPGATAPKLVSREMLGAMVPGAVLVDVAIDQGGCFETSRPTTHDNPTYGVDGIVHYCVANMPGAVPKTSSYALNNATLEHGLALADHGLEAFRDPLLLAGLNVYRGSITSRPVAESIGAEYHDPAGLGLGA